MKVVSLIGSSQEKLMACAKKIAVEFKRRKLKLGVFVQKNECYTADELFHGTVIRYENKTIIEVGESIDLDSLMSLCTCDFLIAINASFPSVPKVILGYDDKDSLESEDLLCILIEDGKKENFSKLPIFNYNEDITSIISYLWLNASDMISNKNIQLTEEFIKYADTAQKNVAIVKIKSNYGFELNCIKKTFISSEAAEIEASYAGVLNTSLQVYPQIIDVVKAVLYREFVDGEKLDKVIETYSADESEKSFHYLESIILSVIDTINFIHNELLDHYDEAYSLGHMNFKNFLVTEDTVYYLDLNGIHQDDCLLDFEKFAAFILESDAIKTNDKRNLINSIINYINNGFHYERELKWTGVEAAFQEIENG